jgi:dihydroorotate dehydrogenase electron transfer subunit
MPLDVAARVISNTRLSPDYNVISLAAPEIARLTRPGQFVMVKPSGGLDPMLRRPFSIFERLREEDTFAGISLLNKRVGRATAELYEASGGEIVSLLGPLGQPFVPVDAPAEAWMVAGGVGLAPFATLAEALADRKTPMTLFYGARSATDLYYASLFEKIGVRLILTTEDGTKGERGRVTAPLERALKSMPSGQAVTIYACGPTPMMRAVADLGQAFDRTVFASLEPVMGCGMGGCYSCVVPVRRGDGWHFVRSCLEGPVFRASDIVWDRLQQGH